MTEQQFELESLVSATVNDRRKAMNLNINKTHVHIDNIRTPSNGEDESGK